MLLFVLAWRSRLKPLRVYEFEPAEFQLESFVGGVGVMEMYDDIATSQTTTEISDTSLRLFLATRNKQRVSLREYSDARVAQRELEIHPQISSGVVPLLGTVDGRDFATDRSFIEAWVARLKVDPPKQDATWLVYDWAGARTAAYLCRKKLPTSLLRTVFRQSMTALASLHNDGIVHRSLGLTSMILDTTLSDKTNLNKLDLKFDFLGFATRATDDLKHDDLNALGYAFLELAFSPAITGLQEGPSSDFLRRLYEDTFHGDMDKFRFYAKMAWGRSVDFLDQKDGWHTLSRILTESSAQNLLSLPFFDP